MLRQSSLPSSMLSKSQSNTHIAFKMTFGWCSKADHSSGTNQNARRPLGTLRLAVIIAPSVLLGVLQGTPPSYHDYVEAPLSSNQQRQPAMLICHTLLARAMVCSGACVRHHATTETIRVCYQRMYVLPDACARVLYVMGVGAPPANNGVSRRAWKAICVVHPTVFVEPTPGAEHGDVQLGD